MKRLLFCVGVVGLMLSGFSVQAAPAGAASGMVTVKGHVLSPDGEGLAGILVKVQGKDPRSQPVMATTRTSRTGRYAVRVPRTPRDYFGYQIYAAERSKPGRNTSDGTWAPSFTIVKTDASPVVQDLRLERGAGLSGRVTDAAGRPVKKGLAVTAELHSKELPVGRRVAIAYTSANGRYRFVNLPPGPTTLCFAEIKATEYRRCYTGEPGGDTDFSKASKFSLTSGRALRGIDFEYPRVKGGISGRVLLDGQAIDSDENFAIVDLLDAAGTVLDTASPYDTFAFRELDAGTYYLRIHGGGDLGYEVGSEYYEDAETLSDATPIVHQRGRNHTGLVLDLTSD